MGDCTPGVWSRKGWYLTELSAECGALLILAVETCTCNIKLKGPYSIYTQNARNSEYTLVNVFFPEKLNVVW